MRLANLLDLPEFFPLVAQWNWREWSSLLTQDSAEEFEQWLRRHLRREEIPLTLLVLDGDRPVGTVSLIGDDMEIRPELGPWLASLYVEPEFRGRGLGKGLVHAAVGIAKRLGVERLFLYTPGQEEFYAALGWRPVETCEFSGRPVTIMSRFLGGREGG